MEIAGTGLLRSHSSPFSVTEILACNGDPKNRKIAPTAQPTVPGRRPGQIAQFHFNPLSWSRFTLPPLSTQTTLDPAGAFTKPCNSAATGAAAAPSTTSLQW